MTFATVSPVTHLHGAIALVLRLPAQRHLNMGLVLGIRVLLWLLGQLLCDDKLVQRQRARRQAGAHLRAMSPVSQLVPPDDDLLQLYREIFSACGGCEELLTMRM